MEKRTKIILGVLAIGITATAAILIIRRVKRRKKSKEVISEVIPQQRIDEIKTTPLSTNNPPNQEEIKMVVEEMPLEFALKTKTEGDQFRGWVNDKYPDYAAEIDLDRTGSYNNNYIRKAWKKYGAAFIADTSGIYTQYVSNISNSLNEFVSDKPATAQLLSTAKTMVSTPINLFDKIINIGLGRTSTPQPTSGFEPKIAAENLYKSMKGWGTNESLFFDTLSPLTKAQRIQVREYYDNNGVGKSLGTLELSIRGDFGGTQLNRALDLIEL